MRIRVASLALTAAAVATAGLLAAGAGMAAKGDPQRKITAADQARARAMLLRRSDFAATVRVSPASSSALAFNCAALDESDLTVTGDADSPNFSTGFVSASSGSEIYQTLADASSSWRRSTAPAGVACVRQTLRTELAKVGVELVSLRRIAFPRVSDRTVAYRVVATAHSQGVTVRVFVDLIAFMRSRAQASLLLTSALVPPVRADALRLARTLAARAKTAMRGS